MSRYVPPLPTRPLNAKLCFPPDSEENVASFLSTETAVRVPFNYTWNGKELLLIEGHYLDSPLFGPENLHSIKFQLRIYRQNGLGIGHGINLTLISSEEPPFSLKYKLEIPAGLFHPSDELTIDEIESELKIGQSYALKIVKSYLLDDNFPIKCEIELKFSLKQKPELKTLINELNSLRLNARFVDVKFVVGVKEFAANKMILSARSPVFSVMFRQNGSFIENRQNRVQIADIDAETFEALLDFIYTSEVKQLDQIAPSLLIAAHKYDIKSLVEICAQSMTKSIATSNAVSYLMYAKMYNLTELKDRAIDVINRNAAAVTNSEDFIKHVKTDHSLMNELYLDFVKKYPQTGDLLLEN